MAPELLAVALDIQNSEAEEVFLALYRLAHRNFEITVKTLFRPRSFEL